MRANKYPPFKAPKIIVSSIKIGIVIEDGWIVLAMS